MIKRGRQEMLSGAGKGEGMPGGLRQMRNTEPCPGGGPGYGQGAGEGQGTGRMAHARLAALLRELRGYGR